MCINIYIYGVTHINWILDISWALIGVSKHVPISNLSIGLILRSARVKNEIRARFNLEFSETALGHVSVDAWDAWDAWDVDGHGQSTSPP